MIRDDFAVFITTHKRPECLTYHTLRKAGYTGDVYFVLDNEDDTYYDYCDMYGCNNVMRFIKKKVWSEMDTVTNEYLPAAVVYARRACYDMAKLFKYKYFLTIDDDVTEIRHKTLSGDSLRSTPATKFDEIVNCVCEYFDSAPVYGLGISDSGIFFGGKNGVWKDGTRNTFSVAIFCRTDKPMGFWDTFNEDIATSVTENRMGHVCFETLDLCESSDTAGTGASGGMTEIYRNLGKVKRSQFTLIPFPDFTTLNENGDIRFNRQCMCPKLISSIYKK